MTTMWHLTKGMIKLFITIGVIFSSLGIISLLLLGSESPFTVFLGLGTAELAIGMAEYLFGTASEKDNKAIFYSAGMILVVVGIVISSLQAFLKGIPENFGLIGSFFFSVGFPIILFQMMASRPMKLTFLKFFGIGLFVAGFPIAYFFGFVPSMNQYIYLSILPLLSGGLMFISSQVGKNFKNISEKLVLKSQS